MKSPIPTEADEQIAFVEYLDLLQAQDKILLYSHIPQETFTRSWGVKMKNKRLGVKRGVPDMLIVTPKEVLLIEMKRTKGGVISPDQVAWLKALGDGEKRTVATLAKGFEVARAFVDSRIN